MSSIPFDHEDRLAGALRTLVAQPLLPRKLAFYSALAALPLGIGLLASKRSRLTGAVAGGLTALVMGAVRWQLARWFTEEPAYRVESQLGKLEIRRYDAHVEASTQVDDTDWNEALQHGFHRLADYIFGDNFRGERLAKTTAMPKCSASETLEMTAPVLTEAAEHGYRMAFVMPPGRDADSLPLPNSGAIEIDEIPARRVAVMRFAGPFDSDSVTAHEAELLQLVYAAGLEPTSQPMAAGFDAPSTLPFLRRNEVWVAIA